MRCGRWLFLLLVLGAAAVSPAGDIQLLCAPGLRVSLDGQPVGITTAKDDGLFLMNVPEGIHVIRVEKGGFLPQVLEVEVAELPIEIKLEELVPAPEPPDEAETESDEAETEGGASPQRLGNLVVTSAPQNCLVEIDGRSEEKSTPSLAIGGLAAGDHTIAFSKPGYDRISGVVTVVPGAEVTVRGNLIEGKVEVVHLGMGSLRVISKPSRCTVRFLGRIRDKIHPMMNLTKLPAGEHPIVISIPGRQLATNVLIMDGQRTILEVSFVKGDEPFVISYVPQ